MVLSKLESRGRTDNERGQLLEQHRFSKVFLTEVEGQLPTASAEAYKFRGYSEHGPNYLPGRLKADELMARLVQADSWARADKGRELTKAFTCKYSVDFMIDTFWWFFCHFFERSDLDQEKLFDRMAENYVKLFQAVDPSLKGSFFSRYCMVMARTVYAAFMLAFPETHTRGKFGEDFRTYVFDMLAEWTTGLPQRPTSDTQWLVDLSALRCARGTTPMSHRRLDHSHSSALTSDSAAHTMPSTRASAGRASHLPVPTAPAPQSATAAPRPVLPSAAHTTVPPLSLSDVDATKHLHLSANITLPSSVLRRRGRALRNPRGRFDVLGRSQLVRHYLDRRQIVAPPFNTWKINTTLNLLPLSARSDGQGAVLKSAPAPSYVKEGQRSARRISRLISEYRENKRERARDMRHGKALLDAVSNQINTEYERVKREQVHAYSNYLVAACDPDSPMHTDNPLPLLLPLLH